MQSDLRSRITHDPNIMVGKPVIRGTRIPVDLIIRMVAQGISRQEILDEYPRLHPDDIQAALYCADHFVVATEENIRIRSTTH